MCTLFSTQINPIHAGVHTFFCLLLKPRAEFSIFLGRHHIICTLIRNFYLSILFNFLPCSFLENRSDQGSSVHFPPVMMTTDASCQYHNYGEVIRATALGWKSPGAYFGSSWTTSSPPRFIGKSSDASPYCSQPIEWNFFRAPIFPALYLRIADNLLVNQISWNLYECDSLMGAPAAFWGWEGHFFLLLWAQGAVWRCYNTASRKPASKSWRQ